MPMTDLDWQAADRPHGASATAWRRIGPSAPPTTAHGSCWPRTPARDARWSPRSRPPVAAGAAARGSRRPASTSPSAWPCARSWPPGRPGSWPGGGACGPGRLRAHAAGRLKWPNDLVAADGAKVGGLLIETTTDGDRLDRAIIGIGINVNWRRADMPAELAGRRHLAGRPGRRIRSTGSRCWERCSRRSTLSSRARGGPIAAGPLPRACSTLGPDVAVETATGRLTGRAVELDRTGALVLDTAAGRVAHHQRRGGARACPGAPA